MISDINIVEIGVALRLASLFLTSYFAKVKDYVATQFWDKSRLHEIESYFGAFFITITVDDDDSISAELGMSFEF